MLYRFNLVLSFLFLSLLNQTVYGGIWSAGGGELIGNSQNPWFLANTKKVNYCVRGDYGHFSLASEVISEKIKSALAYWREQFSMAYHPLIGATEVDLATQEFIEGECSGTLDEAITTHDLVIQLGELTSLQKKFLANPSHYLGITVRTDFDEKTLKGKGFIYISPDSGPLKYEKPSLMDKAWSIANGILLERLLIHEFGHVFGLQHRGSVQRLNIMSAGYPEFLLLPVINAPVLRENRPPDLIAPSDTFDPILSNGDCIPMSNVSREYFSVTPELRCLLYNIKGDRIDVLAKKHTDDSPILIGTIAITASKRTIGEQLIKIGITAVQSVFRQVQSGFYDIGYLPGPAIAGREGEGEYTPVGTGSKRWILFKILPNSFELSGLLNGKFVGNIE